MSNVTRINWFVLVYLAIWCWVDGFLTTAFALTVLVSFEVLWSPFIHSKLAVKLFGQDTMDLLQQKSATSRH